MVALIEKELKIRDKELKKLVKNLSLDTVANVSSRVEFLTTEKQMLNQLLKEQRQNNLFALENGLLLFAIGMFGALAAFVFYLVSVANAFQGTWVQMGSDISVLILLFILTSISTVLYFEYRKQKLAKA